MNLKTIVCAVLLLGATTVYAEGAVKKHSRHHHKKKHHRVVSAPVSNVSSAQTDESYDRLVQNNKPDFVRNEYRALGESLVSTGPYVGIPLQYSGSNLIINAPSVNTDALLLGLRKKLAKASGVQNASTGSQLLLSGVVEGQLAYNRKGVGSNTSTIDLTSVYLDAVILGPSDWMTGFIEFGYDNNPSQEFAQHKVSNSRVLINKAFITIGNFNESPFYATLGQYYVPYGAYSSIMITDPLSKSLGRTKGRALTVGVEQQDENAFYGSLYVFPGFSTSGNQNRINNGGVNLGYKFVSSGFKGNVGAGLIRNIADSVGLQTAGFSATAASQQLDHVVSGYNLRGSLSFGEHIDVVAEYIGASKKFDPSNLSFNGDGARPWAVDLLGTYSFTMMGDKPSAFGLGYGRSGQSVAMGIPKHRYSAVMTTSLYRNTLQSLEFRHDTHYSAKDTGSFAGAAAAPGAGKADNAVTLQFDYFF